MDRKRLSMWSNPGGFPLVLALAFLSGCAPDYDPYEDCIEKPGPVDPSVVFNRKWLPLDSSIMEGRTNWNQRGFIFLPDTAWGNDTTRYIKRQFTCYTDHPDTCYLSTSDEVWWASHGEFLEISNMGYLTSTLVRITRATPDRLSYREGNAGGFRGCSGAFKSTTRIFAVVEDGKLVTY